MKEKYTAVRASQLGDGRAETTKEETEKIYVWWHKHFLNNLFSHVCSCSIIPLLHTAHLPSAYVPFRKAQ